MKHFRFEVLHQSKKSKARVGKLHTPHGVIDTPNFVAVGTNGTIKSLDSVSVDALGLQLMFCNTYHLMLQPGTEVVKQAGGLHRFMNRTMPIITDSGGFQVFSLAYGSVANELKGKGKKQTNNTVLKITEDGVLFRSYRDGSPVFLSPESSVKAQKDLGADIIIPFDELPPYHTAPDVLKASLDRTHRWEKRSLEEHLRAPQGQAMFCVVHGGLDRDLREESARFLASLAFDGFALGGSLGKTRADLFSLVADVTKFIPPEAPIHLLGIGDLESLEACVPHGIDTFDSSYPTKAARHGLLLRSDEPVRIKQSKYALDFAPVDEACLCPTCQQYSRSYLHHLFKASELTYLTLSTIHNLYFMVKLMERYRVAILNDEL
jgi:queuine tRNA-ribosyltransferase